MRSTHVEGDRLVEPCRSPTSAFAVTSLGQCIERRTEGAAERGHVRADRASDVLSYPGTFLFILTGSRLSNPSLLVVSATLFAPASVSPASLGAPARCSLKPSGAVLPLCF